jgi:hypothetical protein
MEISEHSRSKSIVLACVCCVWPLDGVEPVRALGLGQPVASGVSRLCTASLQASCILAFVRRGTPRETRRDGLCASLPPSKAHTTATPCLCPPAQTPTPSHQLTHTSEGQAPRTEPAQLAHTASTHSCRHSWRARSSSTSTSSKLAEGVRTLY